MNASVVVAGNELLSGHTADANGPFLARRMREMGHRLRRITIVPDSVETIVEALQASLDRGTQLVFVCGGLGPTGDDVTADAVARLLERPLTVPPEAKEQIRRIYRKGKQLGLLDSQEVDEGAWRMARVPEGGLVVRNDEGAAPGSVHEIDDEGTQATVYMLPGPPRELQSVFEHLLERELVPCGEALAEAEVDLATFEAPVSEALDALDEAHPEVQVGSYPQHGEKRVVLRLRGPRERVDAACTFVHERMGDLVIDERPGSTDTATDAGTCTDVRRDTDEETGIATNTGRDTDKDSGAGKDTDKDGEGAQMP